MAEATTNPPPGEQDFVALAPGKMVGRYEIVSILGQGGFGITYRARDDQLHREVAIKEYLPSALAIRQDGTTVLPRSTKVADDFGWGRQRFVDEGRTLATLQRAPAIVHVFDFLEANGTAYIVMELVPGDTLEERLHRGPIVQAELDKILWPLLDGLEQVHATGFLHRDIKPANILLDARGNPTLIDFGASRAAIAGRSQAMTAIFTPGYAAAEQMTSAKQGPWTDIYGLSATFYHAITGATPPNAFDRMLDDEYVPLAKLKPEGFTPELLAGLDAGLKVRASDRPQSIEAWRSMLRQGVPEGAASPSVASPIPAPPAAKSGKGVWLGLAAALVLALAGGGYWYATRPPPIDVAAVQKAEAQKKADETKRQQDQADLKRLRDENEKREAEARRQKLEEAARQKIEGEQADARAAKEKADADAKAREAADRLAKMRAEAADKTHAAEVEAGLHLGPLDRQHVQVALTALGFDTNGTDGVFGQHTHVMVAAWQKSRSYPQTGYLTGPENQELLKDGAGAISKFDDEQKKTAAAAPPAAAGPAPNAAAGTSTSAPGDGLWAGSYICSASKGGPEFTATFKMRVSGGSGINRRQGAGEIVGWQSISLQVYGGDVVLSRVFTPMLQAGNYTTGTFQAHLQGDTISGSGPELNSGGRTCTLNLHRTG